MASFRVGQVNSRLQERITDEEYGENWAYFEVWAKREKTLRIRKLIWKRVVEIGAIIGFILAAIHLYELFYTIKAKWYNWK